MSRIIVIDDSSSVRGFIAHTLSTAGHSVATAANGRRGLDLLRSDHFDLVITDLFMPEVDGLETIKQARRDHLVPRLIAISSKDAIMDLLPVARLFGAQATLWKPFTEKQLLATVDDLLSRPCT